MYIICKITCGKILCKVKLSRQKLLAIVPKKGRVKLDKVS